VVWAGLFAAPPGHLGGEEVEVPIAVHVAQLQTVPVNRKRLS
jgi:hypothetical protein